MASTHEAGATAIVDAARRWTWREFEEHGCWSTAVRPGHLDGTIVDNER